MAVQHPQVNMPAQHEGAFKPGNLSHPPLAAGGMRTPLEVDWPLKRLSSHARWTDCKDSRVCQLIRCHKTALFCGLISAGCSAVGCL